MTRRTLFTLIALAVVAWILVVALAGKAISGGDKTFLKVASGLQEQTYIVSHVGSPASITRDDGPCRIYLESDGRRHGFYSITAKGTKAEETLKAYWQELSGGSVEIYALYRTKAWAQDELVWGAPRPELN
jgi:hypothetical protein